jgi:hypothetical protein
VATVLREVGWTLPVRKIPMNYRHITGLAPSNKNNTMVAYEGPIERDLTILAGFSQTVAKFEEQPVRIYYTDQFNKKRSYVPDLLATLRDDAAKAMNVTAILFEVKEWNDLFENLPELKPKFRAARAHARERGWKFKLITDRQIRTSYLDNARFLLRFRYLPPDQAHTEILLNAMRELRESDPDTLLLTVSGDLTTRLKLLTSLWQLVANRVIGADLTRPLTMCSPIWLIGPDKEWVDQCPVFSI